MKKLQQKNKLLLVVTLVLFVAAYFLVFKKTIYSYIAYNKLNFHSKILVNQLHTLKGLEYKHAQYDSILNKYQFSYKYSFTNNLFKKLTYLTQQNKVEIGQFSEPHLYTNKQTKITTYPIVLLGDFNNMLQVVHKLDQLRLGTIKSIQFKKKKNYKNNSQILQCTFYLEVVSS